MYSLGVDIGGTKIAAVIIDEEAKILYRKELPSDPTDKEKMFAQVTACIDLLIAESQIKVEDISGMGVGVPGKVDSENGIAVFQNNLPWPNFPIVQRLKEYYPIDHIVIDNDVYMATFAEWQASDVDKNEDTFVFFTLSTGISCSMIHKGEFLRGAGFAGEMGLVPVKAPQSENGIERLELAAAGPAMEKWFQQATGDSSLTTRDFFQKYHEEDEAAAQLMKDVVSSLAHGIYAIISLIDPQKIVLGGGVINHHPYVLDMIKAELKTVVIAEQQPAIERLATSHFKGDAGIIGAGLRGQAAARVSQ